jgi:segregation and condensation protein B
VIGRPILYKTSKEFLLRFGLSDIHELPSMEEFEKLLAESFQSDMLAGEEQPARQSAEGPSPTASNPAEADMPEGSEAPSSAETA